LKVAGFGVTNLLTLRAVGAQHVKHSKVAAANRLVQQVAYYSQPKCVLVVEFAVNVEGAQRDTLHVSQTKRLGVGHCTIM
jgi:hypothetical protein